MAAPAGAPRRRQVHPGMHVPGRGHLPHGASVRGACMPWLRTGSPRRPRRVAQRSGPSWREGCTLACTGPEGARARARPGGAGTGASTDRHGHARHRPVPPSCVTPATSSLWVRHRRTAHPSACPIPSRFSQAVGIATKSPLCIHTSPRFSAAFRQCPLDQPASPLRPHPPGMSGRDGRLTPRYVDVRQRLGTARPTPATGLPAAVRPSKAPSTPLQVRSGSQGSFRFLRVLPGFSPAVPTGM